MCQATNCPLIFRYDDDAFGGSPESDRIVRQSKQKDCRETCDRARLVGRSVCDAQVSPHPSPVSERAAYWIRKLALAHPSLLSPSRQSVSKGASIKDIRKI